MSKRKILIVDDHPIVRKGLAELIANEADIEACGGAESVSEALGQVRALQPDLVIVDISLKDSHGIDLITQIKASHPQVRMLVWSMFDENIYAERALRAGAMGYITKRQSIEKVVDVIHQVLRGELYFSPEMTRSFLQRASGRAPPEEDPIRRLTDRELRVFEMIGKGMTTQQIAHKLDLSPKTVESHREKIKAKLDIRNAAQLCQCAVQWVLESG